jgi:hypothetical protein
LPETQKGAPRTSSSAFVSRALIWLPLALFAGIIGFQLFGPVPIGLANNRDFARVLGPFRLWPPGPLQNPNLFFKYFVNDYIVTDPLYDLGVPSSEELIAHLAKGIARIILPNGTFQLRLMGLLHGAMLTLALFIFLRALRDRAPWLRLVCGLLLIFIWTDLEYVQQLNTAYTDAGAIVALAVVFSIAVHCLLDAGSWPWALSFTLFGCFLLATKTQHETALPFLIGFCLLAAFRARQKYNRMAWLLASGLLLATVVWMIGKTPRDYRAPPAFSVVFFKLAVLSPDPKSVLAYFRMPEEEFGKYIGHHAYDPGVPIGDPTFQQRIISLVTPASLGSFYWRHPEILTKVLLFDLHDSAPNIDLSSDGYGHLRQTDVQSGKHPFVLVAWDRLRHQLFSVAPFYPIYLFGMAIVLSGLCILIPGMGRRFPVWPVALFSALLAVSSFLFASLLDAVDSARHLVFFQVAADLTIISVVLSICLVIEDSASEMGVGLTRIATRLRTLASRFKWLWRLAPIVVVFFVLWLYRGNVALVLKQLKPIRVTGTFDGTSDEIVYSGAWTRGPYAEAVDGTLNYSNAPGSSARLSFKGTEITWIYARAPNRGIGSVKIDGVPRGDVDQYDPQIIWQSRTAFRNLAPGKHTFEVTVTGRKDAPATDRHVDIDALVVR